MDSKKIFWLMALAIIAGFFVFLALGVVAPVSASGQNGAYGATQPSANVYAAPLPPQSAGAELSAPQPAAGGTLAPVNGGVQEVTLTVQGGNYYPNPIVVKKGVSVRLIADIGKMPGCSKSIVIPEFGIRKTVSSSDNLIEFTPGKSGTFQFSCSMGMYRGTIVVQEADGTVAAYTGSAPAAKAGSCGANGGGCGCGG